MPEVVWELSLSLSSLKVKFYMFKHVNTYWYKT